MELRFREANRNPQAIYAEPKEVLSDSGLTDEEKRAVLENWKSEAIHIEESTAEGFGEGTPSRLEEVVAALHSLDREA